MQSRVNFNSPVVVPVSFQSNSDKFESPECISVKPKISHDVVTSPNIPVINDSQNFQSVIVDDKVPVSVKSEVSADKLVSPKFHSQNCDDSELHVIQRSVCSIVNTPTSSMLNGDASNGKFSVEKKSDSMSFNHVNTSKSVICKSVQTLRSMSNSSLEEVFNEMVPGDFRFNLNDVVQETSGKSSRKVQTMYSGDFAEIDLKSTHSIFCENFSNSLSFNGSVNVNDELKLSSEASYHADYSNNVDLELFNCDVSVLNPSEIIESRNPNACVDVCNMENCSIVPHCNVYGGSLWILAELNGVKCPLMLDTGSAISILNQNFNSLVSPCNVKAKVANGDNMNLKGTAIVRMKIGIFQLDAKVFISPDITDNLLGLDLLKTLNCSIDLVNMKLCIHDDVVPLYTLNEINMIALINGLPNEACDFQLPETISAQIVNVPSEYRGDVASLLTEYAELFRTEPLGTSRRFEHRIELTDPEPIRMMPRRVPLTQYQPMMDEVERMLRMGVIRKSVSPYASPIVLVKKKSGEIRFCVDFRRLNDKTVKDAFPLPHVSDILEALHGAKFFTTLDLSSGFWQIKMRDKDINKTAFCIQNGHYEFLKMPFGLCNSVSTFQRAMSELLKPLLNQGVTLFVDDIVVYSDTIPGLIQRLRQVFDLLRSDNLTLHPGKCVLFRTEVKVLGHRVSNEGIHPLNDKVEVIESWPTPKNKRETRSFLGLCSYYRQYVADFARIAAPMHKLTGKNACWEWTERENESFMSLKQALQTTPVLQLFDPAKPVMVDCDCSGYALGGVLVQPDEQGNEKPVAYYSRCLNKAEASYCVTRQELLAMLCCLRHWRHYLIGRKVLVRTDHSSLTWLRSFKQPESQLARWFSELSQFDIEVIYRPGAKSMNADGLSRRPCPASCSHCQRRESREEELCVRNIQIQAEIDWKEEQIKDPVLEKVIRWKLENVKPPWEEVSGDSPVLKRLWKEWDVLTVQDGILKRIFFKPVGEKFQTIVPVQCRGEVVRRVHEQGHFGVMRTQMSLSDRFYWPLWRTDVKKCVGRCHECNMRKGPHERVRLPERKFLTSEVSERIAVDLCGPFPETKRGNRYMLVITDFFSKWVEPLAVKDQSASTVAQAIINEYICRFGVPSSIYSDNGAQFTSNLVKIICDRLHIRKVNTCPYRPSSNGQCERSNRSLVDALAKVIQDEREWDDLLPLCAMYYRASCHRATGVSPALLALGRELRLPVDLVYPTGPVEKVAMPDYLEKLEHRMSVAAEFARRHLEMDWQSRQKNNGFWTNYKSIDLTKGVYVFRPVVPRGKSFKLARNWWGPYRVVEMINSHLYRIDMGGRNGIQVIHRAHLFQPVDIEDVEEEARNLPCRRRVQQ
jgi:transposase InsO family protein/predicted aspartyl protease